MNVRDQCGVCDDVTGRRGWMRSSGRKLYACMWCECVQALEVPSGGYGYERGCRGRVLDMCGKVVRKDGMGRDSSNLQNKPDLPNTCRLSVYCE